MVFELVLPLPMAPDPGSSPPVHLVVPIIAYLFVQVQVLVPVLLQLSYPRFSLLKAFTTCKITQTTHLIPSTQLLVLCISVVRLSHRMIPLIPSFQPKRLAVSGDHDSPDCTMPLSLELIHDPCDEAYHGH